MAGLTLRSPRVVVVVFGLGCTPDCPTSDAPRWVATATDDFEAEQSDLRLEPPFEASERRVVFRYRSYVGDRPASVSAGATSLVHAEPGDVVRFVRGDGLQDTLVTRFDGAHAYVGDEGLPPLEGGVTVSAWVRADATGGTIVSTDDGTGGLALEIADGSLQGRWSVSDADGGVVSHAIVDPTPVPSQWTSAALRLAPIGDDIQARLYRDDRLVVEDVVPALGGLLPGAAHPTVGSAPDGSAGFVGQIEAVEIREWPVDHDVLATGQIRDGGCAFGRPCYHDSLDETDILARIEDTDRRYPDDGLAEVRLAVPFLDDHYVPQGLEVSEDGRRIYLSAYWSDAQGNALDHPSVVMEIDLEAGSARLYRLFEDGSPYALHVGGVAVLGRTLYVPSRNALRLFDLDDALLVQSADERGTPEIMDLEVAVQYETTNWGSYVELDPDRGALWLGQFVYPGNGTGWLDRYDLDGEGRLAHTCSPAPDERVELPLVEIQGAWPRLRDGVLEVLLTRSWYDRPSEILRWTPGQSPIVIALLPAGIEEIDAGPDGRVWTWFESAARKYQVDDPSAPWSDVYPYIVGLDGDALGTR